MKVSGKIRPTGPKTSLWACLALTVLALAFASVALAAGFVIPPGKESLISTWLSDESLARAGASSWRLVSLNVARDHVAIRLNRGADSTAFQLVHPAAPEAARALFLGKGIALVPPSQLPPDAQPLVQALRQILQDVDGQKIWQVPASADKPPPPPVMTVAKRVTSPQLQFALWPGWFWLLVLMTVVGAFPLVGHLLAWSRSYGLVVLIATAMALVVLELVRVPPPLMLSTSATNLPVWDCLYRTCEWQGESSSFKELRHGALLLRLATGIQGAGFSVELLQRLILAGMSLASGLAGALTWQLLAGHTTSVRLGGAVATASMAVLHTMDVHMFPSLWAPEPLSLPLMLHALVLLFIVVHRSAAAAALAGVCMGACIDAHVAAALLVPATVFLLAIGARRPLVALGLFVAATASWLCACSPSATAVNLQRTHALGLLGPGIVTAFACAGVGLSLRPRFAAALVADRRSVVLFLPGGLAVVGLLVGGAVMQVREPLWKYTEIAVPSFAVAIGLVLAPRLAAWWRRGGWPRVASVGTIGLACGLGVFVATQHFSRFPRTAPTVVDAERLATSLWAHGHDFASVFSSMTGPASNLLAGFVGGYAGPQATGAELQKGPPVSIAVVALESAHLLDQTWLRLPPSAGAQLAWRTFVRYTAIDSATTCSPQSMNKCLERKLFAKPSDVLPGSATQVSSRWLVTSFEPRVGDNNRLIVADPFAVLQLSHTLPIRTGPAVHLIAGLTGWRIVAADGIPMTETQWPGVFRIGGKEASGTIRFETVLNLGWLTPSGLPDFAEVREDELALLVAMQQVQTGDYRPSALAAASGTAGNKPAYP